MSSKRTDKVRRLASFNRRTLLRAGLGGGAAIVVCRVFAASFELRVITSDTSDAMRQILDALQRQLASLQVGDVRAFLQRRGPAVYLALGPAALQAALDVDLGEPLLSLFVSNDVYTRILAAVAKRPRAPVSAIYAEASPHNQMTLVRALYARRVSVGVLITSNTSRQEAALRRAARSADLDLDLQYVEPGENIIRALARLRSASVLLAVPDRDIYTADNLRNILESTYRRNQAVIGFSASLVNAGTLAAAYSTIHDTIAQVGDVIAAMAAGRIPEAQYPVYWRVAINDNVARSLNIVVSDAARTLGNFPP